MILNTCISRPKGGSIEMRIRTFKDSKESLQFIIEVGRFATVDSLVSSTSCVAVKLSKMVKVD